MDFKINLKTTILFIILGISFSNKSYSQYNLTFSKAILLTDTATVPLGKVWKVESVLQGTSGTWQTVSKTSGNNNQYYYSICGFLINGNYNSAINYYSWYVNYSGGNGASQSATSSGFQGTSLPIWLPEGVQIGPAPNSNGISIIEFKVGP